MLKKRFTALYADENILYFDEDSSNVVFNCNGMGILNIELHNINLDSNFIWNVKKEFFKEIFFKKPVTFRLVQIF